MKKPIKVLLPAMLILALGAAGIWWWHNREAAAPAGTLTLYGNIEIRDAQLAFHEQEKISEIRVEEGDVVLPGQVLARQLTDRVKAQINEAEAQVAAQEQRLERLLAGTRQQEIDRLQAEVQALESKVANLGKYYERIRKTAETGASTEQALDDARAGFTVEEALLKAKKDTLALALEGPRKEDIAEAREQLEAAKASLELLHVRLEDMTLRAPSKGVVQSRILEPGEMADPSRPVLILALTDPKWVRAYVSEPNLGHVRPGLQAHVLSDSFPKKTFDGTVGFISPVAEFTPKSVETPDLRSKLVYEIRVTVKDPNDLLRLGMPVTVRVVEDSSAPEPES